MTGMGHVYRCLTLADALLDRFPMAELVFLMDEGVEGQQRVRATVGPEQVQSFRLGEVPSPWCDVVIVDRLQVSPEAMMAFRQGCGFLVSLDDVGPGRWCADLAVGALYLPQVGRPPDSGTRSVDGLSMLALGNAFAAMPYVLRETVGHILLTQGGSDTYGLVPKLVRSLVPWLASRPEVTLHVHTGPAFLHDVQLADALSTVPRGEYHRAVPDLAALYARMDLAVAAAGVMTCELAAVGVPLVIVTGEEKELETAAMLGKAGAARVIGAWDADAGAEVKQAVAELAADAVARRSLSAAARQAVDGRGLDRLIDLIAEGVVA